MDPGRGGRGRAAAGTVLTARFPDRPSRFVTAPDGTRIAVFVLPGAATGDERRQAGNPLVLVHGTTADHRTWRVVGPSLAQRHAIHAIDRRGRGDSGDGPPAAWSIEREIEDVAAVVDAAAAEAAAPVDLVGHSLGGRIGLAAARLTPRLRRVVAYESAPAPGGAALDALVARLRADLAAGDRETALTRFMTAVVGMTPGDLDRFRGDPVWPLRVAAAHTIPREVEAAAHDPAVSLDALAGVGIPVLQLVGGASPAAFRDGAATLSARLGDGRLVRIDGARHAAHHSHPDAFVAAVEAFLAG